MPQYKTLFGVENVQFKQAFLKSALSKFDEHPCIFNDMCHLTDSSKRKCVAHPGGACSLPSRASVFCSGFSCTSCSPLNNASGTNVSAMAENKAVFIYIYNL